MKQHPLPPRPDDRWFLVNPKGSCKGALYQLHLRLWLLAAPAGCAQSIESLDTTLLRKNRVMDGKIMLTEGNNRKRFDRKLSQLYSRAAELTPYDREFVANMQERSEDTQWNPTTRQWNFLTELWLDMVNRR